MNWPLRNVSAWAFSDGLVRYAAGIEDTDDILSDVEQALKVCL